jgi:hypothetical protein
LPLEVPAIDEQIWANFKLWRLNEEDEGDVE